MLSSGGRLATSIWFWVGFNVIVLALLVMDLGVFHRRAHAIGLREAALWSGVWVALSLIMNLIIYFVAGGQVALQFLTGYLIEKSLSVDNLFVFLTILTYFDVPSHLQHRVLFWGIVGALVMRGAFIGIGVFLLQEFHWILYVFGGLLIVTGIRMLWRDQQPFNAETNTVVRAARRLLPVSPLYDGQHFFVKKHGRTLLTPLFLALLLVEISDIIFAVDSIPAIFAVTRDPFIVYTATIMAVLGLRSMYFLLAGIMPRFHKLRYGLAAILVFVGAKMVLEDVYEVPIVASLAVVGLTLAVSVAWSLLSPAPPAPPPPPDVEPLPWEEETTIRRAD